MSIEDVSYLANYLPETLYVNPGKKGAYATLLTENEVCIAEIKVTERSRLAVSAFFVNEKGDFGTFKISKLKFHAKYGWGLDGEVRVNHFDLVRLKAFVALIASLNLHDTEKKKIFLGEVMLDELSTFLASSRGPDLIRALSSSPELPEDIYAVAKKRSALEEFKQKLGQERPESEWQAFFEYNPWIFGHGLNYVFLDKVDCKLEAATTGASFDRPGKRADGLMQTRAEVSQFVLVEIKRDDTRLLQSSPHRPGCWAVSEDLSKAVTQVQKTVFEFSNKRFRNRLKDESGNDLPKEVYSIEPRSYLVVGNLSELCENEDKITCFELYRKNVRAPEILTFDELYQRAKCIIDNLSREAAAS